jgi:hypothetical protein
VCELYTNFEAKSGNTVEKSSTDIYRETEKGRQTTEASHWTYSNTLGNCMRYVYIFYLRAYANFYCSRGTLPLSRIM